MLRVPDVMNDVCSPQGRYPENDVCLPQGRYPENFVLVSQLEVCQEGGSRRGVLGGHWGFLTRDMEDRVIPDVMYHVFLPLGRYPDNFVLISQLEIYQELGVKEEGTLRTFRVADQRHRQCHN